MGYKKEANKIIRKHGWFEFLKRGFGHFLDKIDMLIVGIRWKYYVAQFHKIFFYRFTSKNWEGMNWLGRRTLKSPLDLWIYQEIIDETKPDYIIETGTADGGSALYLASLCDLMKNGKVITVDIETCDMTHPRVTKIIGDSTSEKVINQIKGLVKGKTAMVILDSDHAMAHVYKEMNLYNQFVSKGNYLIVEDTDVNGHPVLRSHGKGPMEAVRKFLQEQKDFKIDKSREKFLMTLHPNGFLRRE